MNIDEATNDTLQKILTALVSFFCEEKKEVVVRHLVSLNMSSVTTGDIYNALVSLFDEKKIPWEHSLASLMDSCIVMQGSKNGLQKKLRETVCPNLLDIDGDSCHHIHNGYKVFTEVFGKHFEYLFQSIYSDFKWSEDHRNIFKDIFFVGLTYRRPEMYSPTRWLKIHDSAIQTDYIFDAPVELVYAFSSKSDQLLIKIELKIQKRDARFQCKELLLSNRSLQPLKKKRLTKAGKKRKEVIRYYFKEYVMLFQEAESAIHKLYDDQFKVMREFLANFIKAEVLVKYNTPSKLQSLDCSNPEFHLRKDLICIGSKVEKIRSESRENDAVVASFLKQALDVYVKCGIIYSKNYL